MTDTNKKLLQLIIKNYSNDEICKTMNITKKELKRRIESLKYEGFNITKSYNYSGTQNYIFNKERLGSEEITTIHNDTNKDHFKAIAIADTHIGHSKYNMKYLDLIYNYCKKNNINIVLHCGDLMHGHKQFALNPQQQLETVLERYPYDPSILTFLAFGNHEETFLEQYGINLKTVIERNREDIIPLGYGECIIKIDSVKDEIVMSHINHSFESNGVRLSGHSHRYKFIADDYNPLINVPTLSDFLHTNDFPGAVEIYLESCNDKIRHLMLKHLVINGDKKIKEVSQIHHKSCKTNVRK